MCCRRQTLSERPWTRARRPPARVCGFPSLDPMKDGSVTAPRVRPTRTGSLAAAFQMIPLAAERFHCSRSHRWDESASVVPRVPVQSNRTGVCPGKQNRLPGDGFNAAELPEPSRRSRLLFLLIKKNHNGVPRRERPGRLIGRSVCWRPTSSPSFRPFTHR